MAEVGGGLEKLFVAGEQKAVVKEGEVKIGTVVKS